MISPEIKAEIRRLFFAEHWKIGTIAASLSVHVDAVRNAIEVERFKVRGGKPRTTQLDAYLPMMRETLAQYPKLRATRLFAMLKPRGYVGSEVQVRRAVRLLLPKPKTEAYLRLRVLPGEQAQVDWGSFGTVTIGRHKRPLSCFVMVLSWSRAIHAVFTLDQTMESFLRGHVEAFAALGGVARVLLYDNLKSAVLERRGEAIQFHPRLLELAGHYHFAPRPCAVARGNEKGRVERQIQYLRTSFFAARSFRDVDDLNAQFLAWRDDVAHVRACPGDDSMSVADALIAERSRLLPMPEHPFESDLVRGVSTGKTPYVRFDRNLYSVPHTLVGRPLTLVAGPQVVRVVDGLVEVARHSRSYGSGDVIEVPEHIEALAAQKRAARESTGRDRLHHAAPTIETLFLRMAERGESLWGPTTRLLHLLDDYGPAELSAAVDVALERASFSAASVAHVLEQRRRAARRSLPMRVTLPSDPRVRDVRVTPHNLETYDALGHDEPKRKQDE